LCEETRAVMDPAAAPGAGPRQSSALWASPLVLLTALQSLFDPDTPSARHRNTPTPAIEDDGSYTARADARPMRLFTQVDTRLMFEDMFLKLQEFDTWLSSS